MTKRLLSFLLAVLTLFALAVPAFAEPADEPEPAAYTLASGSCGAAGSDLRWSLSSTGVLTITGSGKMKDYDCPAQGAWMMPNADTAPWLTYAFDYDYGCDITRAVFGSGITYIGTWCLPYCDKLTSVVLPGTLTSIGEAAFAGSSLRSLSLPASLKTIGSNAFTGNRIDTVTIPASVTYIGSRAFSNSGGGVTIGGLADTGNRQAKTVTIQNPYCTIDEHQDDPYNPDSRYGIYTFGNPSYTVIKGYTGSTAQTFAKKHGFTFQSIGTVKKGWVTEGGRKYYYQNGKKATGLWVINKKHYYFSVKDGHMLTGLVNTGNGKTRYFSPKSGVMLTGLVNTGGGKLRYFSAKNGVMLTGLVNTGSGKIRYFSAKNGVMLTGLVNTGSGKTRYFSVKDGHMLTGLVNTGHGETRYFSARDGHMMKGGLVTVSGRQYYLSARDGHVMKGGWIYVGGRPKYYANSRGVITKSV